MAPISVAISASKRVLNEPALVGLIVAQLSGDGDQPHDSYADCVLVNRVFYREVARVVCRSLRFKANQGVYSFCGYIVISQLILK